jgi:transposase
MPSSAYLRAEMTEVNDTTTTARHSGQSSQPSLASANLLHAMLLG